MMNLETSHSVWWVLISTLYWKFQSHLPSNCFYMPRQTQLCGTSPITVATTFLELYHFATRPPKAAPSLSLFEKRQTLPFIRPF